MAKRMFPILAVIVLAAAVLGGGWLSARSKAAKREATISAIEEEMADHFFGNVVWHFRDQGMSEDAAWQRAESIWNAADLNGRKVFEIVEEASDR